MKRRGFLRGAIAMPLVGLVRPESLTTRRAVFEEAGTSVLMTLRLPTLIKPKDVNALKSIDSGFDTTLRYSLRVWEYGQRRLITSRIVVVKIRLDLWKKRYVVSTRGDKGWSKRFFTKRADAVAAATKLDRQKIASVGQLERSDDGPYYFVEVLALRNPVDETDGGGSRSASGRGGGRDLEWFSRLVDVMAGERARAEKVVHIRTNPFFLVP